MCGKSHISLIAGAEQGDDLSGKELEHTKSQSGDHKVTADSQPVSFLHTVIFACPVVESHNGL